MTDDPTGTPRVTDKRRSRQAPPPVEGELRPEGPPQQSLFAERLAHLTEEGRRRDLTEEERSELLQLQAMESFEQPRQPGQSVLTAFVVLVGHDSSAVAMPYGQEGALDVSRPATLDDMFAGASIVVRDINASLAGRHVLAMMQQQAAMLQQQQVAAQLANGLSVPRRR